MENICLVVTDDLYRFLVGILPKEHGNNNSVSFRFHFDTYTRSLFKRNDMKNDSFNFCSFNSRIGESYGKSTSKYVSLRYDAKNSKPLV